MLEFAILLHYISHNHYLSSCLMISHVLFSAMLSHSIAIVCSMLMLTDANVVFAAATGTATTARENFPISGGRSLRKFREAAWTHQK